MNTSAAKMDSPENKQKFKKIITKETAESSNNKIKVDSSIEISQFKTQEISSPNIDKKKNRLMISKDSSPEKKQKGKNLFCINTIKKEKSKSNNDIPVNISRRTNKKRVRFTDPFADPVNVESFKRFNLGMSYNETEQEEPTRCKCVIF